MPEGKGEGEGAEEGLALAEELAEEEGLAIAEELAVTVALPRGSK